jgi:ankyrin repeat protein
MKNVEEYNPYDLMPLFPNERTKMIGDEIQKFNSNLNLVKDLISLGVDVDFRIDDGMTALQWAILKDKPEIVQILIDAGSDVNAKAEESFTALHLSVGSFEITQMLIAAGADVNAQEEENIWTPLLLATDEISPEVVKLLIDAGANVNAQNGFGHTALHLAAKYNNIQIINMLLDAGANRDIQNVWDATPYDLAISEEIKTILKSR